MVEHNRGGGKEIGMKLRTVLYNCLFSWRSTLANLSCSRRVQVMAACRPCSGWAWWLFLLLLLASNSSEAAGCSRYTFRANNLRRFLELGCGIIRGTAIVRENKERNHLTRSRDEYWATKRVCTGRPEMSPSRSPKRNGVECRRWIVDGNVFLDYPGREMIPSPKRYGMAWNLHFTVDVD